MEATPIKRPQDPRLTLAGMPIHAKALVTCIIWTLALGMLGALGQVIVHDIIPTFYAQSRSRNPALRPDDRHAGMHHGAPSPSGNGRGDLFADLAAVPQPSGKPFYQQEQFVWTLKWTHIHLFGMGMIFIFVGAVTIWLDAGSSLRARIVILPFIGVSVDIMAMWLKTFVHLPFSGYTCPGGCLPRCLSTYPFGRCGRWGSRPGGSVSVIGNSLRLRRVPLQNTTKGGDHGIQGASAASNGNSPAIRTACELGRCSS